MQIRQEQARNTAKAGLLRRVKASSISRARRFTGSPFAGGGVLGKEKEKKPSSRDTAPAR